MKQLISVQDIPGVSSLVQEAIDIKKNPFAKRELGKNKSLALFFFNPSLRTRLSTIRAAQNLGMSIIESSPQNGWPLEFKTGAIMNANKSEHIQEAAAVISQYADILAIRSFAALQDRDEDRKDPVITAFQAYASKPVLNMESARFHPLQGLADMITIEEHKTTSQPKIVLTWAPHPKVLPQAVPNSFVNFCRAMNYDLTITHPKGYDLDPSITEGCTISYDQTSALAGADFVYAKNWSSSEPYATNLCRDNSWILDAAKMSRTNEAYFMHCLPVRRNVVVSDAVLNGTKSIVIKQAYNRVFSAQAILQRMLSHTDDI